MAASFPPISSTDFLSQFDEKGPPPGGPLDLCAVATTDPRACRVGFPAASFAASRGNRGDALMDSFDRRAFLATGALVFAGARSCCRCRGGSRQASRFSRCQRRRSRSPGRPASFRCAASIASAGIMPRTRSSAVPIPPASRRSSSRSRPMRSRTSRSARLRIIPIHR